MKTAIVIPNWNGADLIGPCLKSLQKQTVPAEIIVVDNGSVDESIQLITEQFPDLTLIELSKNTGFAGGVNTGIKYALERGFEAIALFNNDAVADPAWLKLLCNELERDDSAGIVTCKFTDLEGSKIDSTGDIYTTWGLLYPRGRGEKVSEAYDKSTSIFGASGGASLYRSKMFREVGLFDEDFFAYYEDGDISFRAQLAGWKVKYVPKATARHLQGATSSKIKDFTTYHTIKNLPWLMWKNVPRELLPVVAPRLTIAHLAFCISALSRGQIIAVTKGLGVMVFKLPKKLVQRRKIQKNKKVSSDYIASILTWDLPANAYRLRKLRAIRRKIPGL